MKRGRKKGSVQEGSMVYHVKALKTGESIVFDCDADDMEQLAHSLGAHATRSPLLMGRKFSGEQVVIVAHGSTVYYGFRVTRHRVL